jgi:hypothetical protein
MGVSIGLSIGALAVAVYAVVLSRQALAHQKKEDQARLQPDVRVELEHGTQAAHPLIEWSGDAGAADDLAAFVRRGGVLGAATAGQLQSEAARVEALAVEIAALEGA